MPPGENFNDEYLCPLCKRRHTLRKCRRFLSMPIEKKLQLVDDEDVCKNCLGLSHRSTRRCPSKDSCHKCHMDHHTILHSDLSDHSVVLKMTAMAYVAECEAEEGFMWRIVLNPSQTHSTVAAWSIYQFASMANVKGYPETFNVYLWSRFPGGKDQKIQVCLKVVDQPMEYIPSRVIKRDNILRRLNKCRSADLFFWRPEYAPITLGADAARKIYIGAPKINPSLPMSQCTIFGWTFFGDVKTLDIKLPKK